MIEDIGAWIKKARTDAGMTQAALASMLDGVTAADISKVERGLTELMPQQLDAVAAVIGAIPETLMPPPKAEPVQESEPQPSAPVMNETELLEIYRKADSETRSAVLALLRGENNYMPVLTALFSGLMKNLTLSGGPIAGILKNVAGLFDGSSDGAENPLVKVLNGVTEIVSGVMSMKANYDKEKADKAAGGPDQVRESSESAETGAKVPLSVGEKAISGPLLGFTFSYSVVIYLLLLSFYFWLWRTDITPRKDAGK